MKQDVSMDSFLLLKMPIIAFILFLYQMEALSYKVGANEFTSTIKINIAPNRYYEWLLSREY